MQYFDEEDILLVMLETEYPSVGNLNTLIYRLEPYNTTPYSAQYIYDPSSSFFHLDRFSNNRYCAVGELKTGGHSFLASDILSFANNQCVVSNSVNVVISPEQLLTGGNLFLNNYQAVSDSLKSVLKNKNYNINCINKNR